MTILDDEKKALRQLVRTARAEFVATLPPSVSHLVFSRPPSTLWDQIANHDIFALYTPMKNEPPTQRYAHFLLEHGKQLALPRFDTRDTAMTFALWDGLEESLEPGPFGQLQPFKLSKMCVPEVYFMPLVAFDTALNRLGQGGGHYDRYFARCQAEKFQSVRIGLAWSVQQVDKIPINEFDVPLDAVITQSQFFSALP
jgi:5-formyltetrahydrofolate cyclo-ligase